MARLKRGGKSENRLRRQWSAHVSDHCIGTAWSGEGRILAAAAVSGPITLFDGTTGKLLHELAGHGFGTTAIAFQPGTSTLASTGQDGRVKLWDGTSGREFTSQAGGSAWVEHLAWHKTGRILATSAGKIVRLWDAGGTLLREYADHPNTVADLAWRPGTNQLAVAHYGGVRIYDADQDEVVRKYEWSGSPLKLAWSRDGKFLAHGNQDCSVHFWFAETGRDLEMPGYPMKVRELSWDSASRFLATGGGPGVVIWDCGGAGPAGTNPQMIAEEEDELPLVAVEWQARGYLLAAAGKDGRIRLLQPANKKNPVVGQDRLDEALSVAEWAPDDRLLAVGAASGEVVVYRVE